MRKEALTIENIQKDLNKYFCGKIRTLLLTLPFIPIANIIILNIILLLYNPKYPFKTIFSIMFCSVCFMLVSYDIITTCVGFIQTKAKNFEIISSWVVNKKQKTYGTRTSSPKPYRLIFANNHTYKIPTGENYCWSSLFSMDDETLYKHTDINDDFYIINIKKQKTILAYNKKFIEFIK